MSLHATTVDELAAQNSDNQRTEYALAFTENPPVVFSCVINQTFPTHDKVFEFAYDTPSGVLADVLPGMTAWIGSSAGHYDYGQVRIRKTPIVGMMYVSEGSEIAWANDLHVTIIDEMGLWPKHLFIDDDQIIYMDKDIAYTDQHEVFDPVPIMGCNAVLDVTTYPATVRFPEANRSWVFDSTISAWLWTATEGTFDNATIFNPILTINAYPVGGQIRVALKLTSAAGAEFTGYRYVKVYDADHRPLDVFRLDTPVHGDYSAGGFSFDVTLYTNATRAEIRDRAPVMLISVDYYGDEIRHIGQLDNRENIEATGFIRGETIVYDPSGGTVSFSVEGPQFWMGKMNGYPTGVRIANKQPDKWTMMPNLDVDRGAWHFLHWRTTATAVLDVTLTGDTRYLPEASSAQGNLWSQIAEITTSIILATGGFDPWGRLFISIDPQMTPVADRTWVVIQDIQPEEWEGELQIERRPSPEVAQLFFSGIAVDASGKAKSYFSISPGRVPRRYGNVEPPVERMLLVDQDQANEMCGLLSGWKNNQYPKIGVRFAQNNKMFTLFPPQFAHITINETDTERGISRSLNLVPRSITREWDIESGVASTTVNFEAETLPDLSVTGDIPGIIDAGDIIDPPDSGEVIVPIEIVVLPPGQTNLTQPSKVVHASSNFGIHWTETFDAPQSTYDDVEWFPMNDGLTEDIYPGIHNLIVTPSGALFIQTTYKVFAAPHSGGTWTQIASITDFNNGYIHDIAINPNEDEEIVIIGSINVNGPPMGKLVFANSSGITPGANSMRLHYFRAGITYANDMWHVVGCGDFVFASPVMWHFNGSGGLLNGESGTYIPGLDAQARFIVACGTQDIMFYWEGYGNLSRVTNDGTVFTALGLSPMTNQGLAPSPTGNVIMARNNPEIPYKSIDGGDTWESVADTIPVGSDVWENCGDDNRWIFGGGTVIRLTLDVGETYIDKMGNLPYIAPLIDIVNIRFIE